MTAASREEQAELEMLRDEADRTAADAARTLAELTGRLSPRRVLSPRAIVTRLGRSRSIRLAAVVIPVTAALAAAAVATAVAVRRRRA